MVARYEDNREAWTVDITYHHPDGRRQRVRKDSPVNTRRGAEEYERQTRQSLLDGSFGKVIVEVPTLEEFVPKFLTDYVRGANKASERQKKKLILERQIVPWIGKKLLSEIGEQEIAQLKSRWANDGRKAKTINNRLIVFGKLLRVACDWQIIAKVPAIELLKVQKSDFDFLEHEEAEQLEAAAGKWLTMIVVARNTGLRAGELLALTWQDVDLKAAVLTVNNSDWYGQVASPKSGDMRRIPLNAPALAALKAARHLRSKLVFCHEDGRRLSYVHTLDHLHAVCRKAGLREIGWHTLRHTFASHLVMAGVTLKAVQELMGHATIEMTLRYAHLAPGVTRDAVAALAGAGQQQVNKSTAEQKQQ